MTKEEIRSQIDGIYYALDFVSDDRRSYCLDKIFELQEQLQSAESIQDLLRKAFEDSRDLANGWEAKSNNVSLYETYEDYLKTKS